MHNELETVLLIILCPWVSKNNCIIARVPFTAFIDRQQVWRFVIVKEFTIFDPVRKARQYYFLNETYECLSEGFQEKPLTIWPQDQEML